jgi:Transposase DDE domain.
VTAVLRPAKRPSGREIAAQLRRLFREIRSHWPRVEIVIRGDGHYCAPEVLDLCRARGVDFILGLPTTSVLRAHVTTLEASTTARAEAAEGATIRRFKEFYDGAGSWSRVERIIARVEAGPRGCDTRFIVTSLTKGTGKTLYEGVYCARGQAENHIKAFKTHLAADRTSCTSATANQLRLFLHAGAYWLMWTLRAALPKRSPWRRAQFDTLRLRVVKIAARVVEMKTRITLHLPSACPAAPLMRLLLERLPRMAPV